MAGGPVPTVIGGPGSAKESVLASLQEHDRVVVSFGDDQVVSASNLPFSNADGALLSEICGPL
jgi:hypothetical protein